MEDSDASDQSSENPTSTNTGSKENSGDVKPVLPFTEKELEEYRRNKSNWEDIAIEYETDGEGFSGLGISITDVDVGHGPGDKWIFVTALTDGGAALRDGRLQVNDQILEVNRSNLRRVTREHANHVLSKTEGNVGFQIRRANETWKSKMHPLIQQTQALEQKQENPTSTNMGSEENSGDAKPVLPFTKEELGEYRRNRNKSNWEEITVEYETDGEGFSGLGISITDVDVGWGPCRRYIFVTALTDGGAAQRDWRLQINDRIMRVDDSNLRWMTRAYANHVLSKTKGNISFQIQRANETWTRKMAPLIQQTQELEQKQRAMRKEVTITSEPDVRQWMSDTSTQWEGATLHLHILDADTSYNGYISTEDAEGLVKDLHSLSVFTDGILVSWGGRTEGEDREHTLVNDALSPLLKDGCYADHGFQNGKSLIVAAPLKDEANDSPSHHVLKLSDPQSSTRVQQCLMDNSVSDGMPAVCIVINGGIEVLRMVCHALEKHIPVIVCETTGGAAALIQDLVRCNDVRDKASMRRDIERCCQNSEAIQEDDVDRVLKLHNMDIFNRSVTTWRTDYVSSERHLDEVICEAFLKGEKYQHADTFLYTMQKRVREMENEVPKGCHSIVQSSGTLFWTFLQFPTTSAAAIYRSLNVIYSEKCSDQLLEAYDRLQWMGGVKYNYYVYEKRKRNYMCVRGALYQYTKQLMATPLGCPGWEKCPKCKQVLEFEEQRETCLPAQQELFILSLFHENQHLTEAVLEHVEGKMAACMMASVVYTGRAQEEEDNAKKQKLRQLASRYEALARDCFQHCCQTDEGRTRHLMTKPLDDWDGFFPLQIAIITDTKALIDTDFFNITLDMIWKGTLGLNTKDLGIISPRARYFWSLVFQLLFLLLFSYEVLVGLQTTSTWRFFVLAFYVFDLLVHEIHQFLVGSLLQQTFTCNIGLMLRRYFTNMWNYFDLIVILLFLLGMLVFLDNDIAFTVGRVSLCLDFLVLCLRFLQMFMYFKDLGIFLVMAQKSISDLLNFMLIMMMVMLGYLVASHGMLFPPPNNITTWSYVGDLPFKGYWQAFNNFDLQDISVCQQVTRQELEDGECKTESFLATEYGHYISSVLLVLYLMFINVMMMNLLIAKFNNTFEMVQEEAVMHQNWYSFQLLQEHFHTPAPFFTLSLLFTPLSLLFTFLLHYWCRDPRHCDDSDDTDLNQFEAEQFYKASDALKTAVNIGSLEDVPSRLHKMEQRMQQQIQGMQQQMKDVQQGLQQQMQDVQQGLQQQMQEGLQQVLEKLTPADQHSTRTTQQHTATRSPEPVSLIGATPSSSAV